MRILVTGMGRRTRPISSDVSSLLVSQVIADSLDQGTIKVSLRSMVRAKLILL